MDLKEANRKRRRNNRMLWSVLATAIVAGLVSVGVITHLNNQATANTTPNTISQELKDLLDVASAPLEESECPAIVERTGGPVVEGTYYPLLLETLKGVKEGDSSLRQWSDALSIPLKGSTAEEKRTYVQRAICDEPLIGVSFANLMANLEVEGVRVVDIQSTDWLKPFAGDASKINDLVAGFMPVTQWQLENIGKQDTPEDVYRAGEKANLEYQEVASRLNLLLSKYELGDVKGIASTHHYHLVSGGLVADSIPEVGISSEVDNRPTLVFYLTKKTDECTPLSVLGFNVGDKRPLLGAAVSLCEEVTAPGTPGTPGTPGVPGTPGTPENPECTENCGPGITPKNPSADPGGGPNSDPGPGIYIPQAQMEQPPSTPRVDPAPPISTPPAATPDPTPAPAPEPSAPVQTAPETGCTPMPGVTC